ncbi:universal stress protein [Streptomyces sp. NPDC006733]|uniref:universal stress protein n=1 Tax=Streptomyces sp. NPDC006733 TaxID=3155460 RepID=UPI0033F60CCD
MKERWVIARVDGSGPGMGAARWAATEAVRRGCALRLLGTRAPGELDRPLVVVRLRHPGLTVATERVDHPLPALMAAGADGELLVVSALHREAMQLAGGAPCPVAMVRMAHAGEVVLGLDARRPDDTATGFAFEVARRDGHRLRAVHAWQLPLPYEGRTPYPVLEDDRAEWEDEEVQTLADALRSWREKYPEVEVIPDVRLFTASWALVNASARAEMVVLGRGPDGLGPVGHAVAEFAESPVVFVPR